MKKSATLISLPAFLAAFALLLLAPVALLAQGAASAPQAPPLNVFVGNYKGTAKAAGGNFDFSIEIKSENGKLHGSLVTPQGEQTFASSELSDMTLKIKLGAAGSPELLTLQPRDGKLVGDWKAGKETRAVVLERVVPTPDSLTGVWDAAADNQGEAFPFTLTLKLDGEKVTGSSSSQLGDSTISSGSWKDGKLAIVLDSGGGPIALAATMVDGKLAGDFDYNGQMQGKWVASRKKP
jgi:hypothetical protein